jgi:hypothetical protein
MFNTARASLTAMGGQCAAVSSTLGSLYYDALVSWWQPQDLAPNGEIVYGVTWPTQGNVTPILALHLWLGSFSLPTNRFLWLMAHEGYHAMIPQASEASAQIFASACGGVWP